MSFNSLKMVLKRKDDWKNFVFGSAKINAQRLLFLFLGLCSIWPCWDLLKKFSKGSITVALEKQHRDYLPLPHIVLCRKRRYKYQELSARQLPDNFFDDPDKTIFDKGKGSFPNLNETWLKTTWSQEDLEVGWKAYEGGTTP